MDVRNISHPQLVYTIHCAILDQVGINPKIVVAIGCADPFTLARSTAPALLTHDPGNFFVVDDPTFALQPASAIARKRFQPRRTARSAGICFACMSFAGRRTMSPECGGLPPPRGGAGLPARGAERMMWGGSTAQGTATASQGSPERAAPGRRSPGAVQPPPARSLGAIARSATAAAAAKATLGIQRAHNTPITADTACPPITAQGCESGP